MKLNYQWQAMPELCEELSDIASSQMPLPFLLHIYFCLHKKKFKASNIL
jgi:hypothetical protein